MSKDNKKLSAQQKGKLNAKKVYDWLATNPDIPVYQGKVNKTAICKQHDIPKSTIETNSELRKLFEVDGPIDKRANKQKQGKVNVLEPNADKDSARVVRDETTSELINKIDRLERSLNSIHLDLASEEFLLATGRYIPRLYSDLEDD